MPLPDWVVAAADSVLAMDSAESTAAVYPADRAHLIDAFVACLGHPAQPQTVRVRSLNEGAWRHVEIAWLNLLDHEEVGCLVCTIEVVDGPVISDPGDHERGGHAPTNWMVMGLSPEGEIVSVEGRVEEVLGYPPHDLVGHRPTDFLSADTVSDAVRLWLELRAAPGNVSTSIRPWMRRDGTEIWLEVSYLNRDESSPEAPVLAVAWDITERREQEEALVQREAEVRALAEEFRLLADQVPAAVFRCDGSGNVLFHNSRWTELLHERNGVVRLHDFVAPVDRPALDAALQSLGASPEIEQRTLQLADADGRTVWGLTLRSVSDTTRSERKFVGSLHDETATVALRRQARHDALTGLLNRQALEESLAEALEQGGDEILVLFLDLDRFKAVNDTYGHQAGDVVLAEVGRRLANAVRPDDHVGRYGGDEFVVVCRSPGSDDDAIRDRLVISLGGPISFPGGSWQPTASVGFARPAPADRSAEVLQRADLAMFEIKRSRAIP